ncbi:macrolide ABC transporter ATP-binding protein [Alteromonas sp. V450]|uniref:ABC transporter ATP-binding protein n=1 Tax=Alteromonas sp. V450 TaxID=1912139 RepID=UPI0008FF3E89|nr:ABC transporter ATP-binding protein [Alteromonas sp. V450]OJF68922.1 macrolide ABC transporter ATP-binding protein [Alteromonas sp. V450]
MNEDVIKLTDVSKRYVVGEQEFHALKSTNLTIKKNEYVAITGHSGSGKSTLLNVLGCLDEPSTGTYSLNGIDTNDCDEIALSQVRNKAIGFIFQSFNLLPKISVLDNIQLPLVYQGVARRKRLEKAYHFLEKVGLADKRCHLPNQLSGGQRQRIAIARALVTEPAILLGDEPTGNLDSETTAEIMQLFHELHREGHTLLLVTHEDEISAQCKRVLKLKDGLLIDDYYQEQKQYA